MNNKKMFKGLSYITIILWMILIFKFSSQPAQQSGKLSTVITKIGIKVINKVNPNTKFDIVRFDHIIRKNAHFFIYLVLGILVMNVLKRIGVVRYKSIALLICILYAETDELHQFFVPGRGAGVKDVLIDSVGAAVGILVVVVIGKVRKRV